MARPRLHPLVQKINHCENCGECQKLIKGMCKGCTAAHRRICRALALRTRKNRLHLPPQLGGMREYVTHKLHTCKACGVGFYPKNADRTQFCGRVCGLEFTGLQATARRNGGRVYVQKKMIGSIAKREKMEAEVRPFLSSCWKCGNVFDRRAEGATCHFCSSLCVKAAKKKAQAKARKSPSARRAKMVYKARRKAMLRGAEKAERVDPIKVFERDGWRCGICRKKTIKSKRGTNHPKAPELDHIVPVSKGGSHDWANVQCACRECNGLKGATTYGQLNLFAVAA
jgi:5-methylcytosine-specific restriction endonuclease McrA